ncbi:hypothetical protein ACP70R_018236 [Stipagrostis hirtigluma subsp. patula]
MATSSAAGQCVKHMLQKATMIESANSVLSSQHVAHMSQIEIGKCGGNPVLPHSDSLTGHAGNLGVDPSEDNKKEPRGMGPGKEDNNGKQNKAQKMFKPALINFVKEQLKLTWNGGCLSKGLYKVIVQKVVEKIISSEKSIPETKQKVDNYLRLYSKKINKLIKDYLHKYTNQKLRLGQQNG